MVDERRFAVFSELQKRLVAVPSSHCPTNEREMCKHSVWYISLAFAVKVEI